MLRKVLVRWHLLPLLVAFGQCNQCRTSPVEDITQWKLAWNQPAALSSFPASIDVEEGIFCHVPSEDEVYFLNPDGASWKFTQTSAGGLTSEPIGNFLGTRISGQESFFAFPAGSIQSQALHVGIINEHHVTLKKHKGRDWEEVWSSALEVLKNNAQVGGSACSMTSYEEAQLHGLIVLKPKEVGQPSVVLCYDAKKNTLEPSNTWQYKGDNAPNTAIEIAPGALLVSEKTNASPTVFYWAAQSDQCVTVPGQTFSAPERTSLFLLHARGLMSQAVCACFLKESGKTKLQFYTVTHAAPPYTMHRSSDLPEELEEGDEKGVDNNIDHSTSLVLPFLEAVYVVTKDKNDQPIYYKGSLREPTQQG